MRRMLTVDTSTAGPHPMITFPYRVGSRIRDALLSRDKCIYSLIEIATPYSITIMSGPPGGKRSATGPSPVNAR